MKELSKEQKEAAMKLLMDFANEVQALTKRYMDEQRDRCPPGYELVAVVAYDRTEDVAEILGTIAKGAEA